MNKIFLIGNTTKEAELFETEGGTSLAKTSLAVNYNAGEEKKTDFFNLTIWGAKAETFAKYVKKGHKVAICGSLHFRTYQNKDGKEIYSHDVVVEEFEFLQQKESEDRDEPSTNKGLKKKN